MGVGAGLYMYVVVVQKFTFAILSPDEFLYLDDCIDVVNWKCATFRPTLYKCRCRTCKSTFSNHQTYCFQSQ